MIRIVRSATPNYLVNYKKWGMEVFKKKSKNPAYEINWKQYKKQKIYPRLLVSLKQMTKKRKVSLFSRLSNLESILNVYFWCFF